MTFSKQQLAYCSNVHPGEDVHAVMANIAEHFSAVRMSRELPEMASGLWLSAKAADALLQQADLLTAFQASLTHHGVLLTSLNGFPYGDFHQAVVKQNVYLPTWAQPERLIYTKNLAMLLAKCLPSEVNKGAISTLPLAYADGWQGEQHDAAIANFIELALFLADLEKTTGKRIVVCIEMEPDCVLQYTDELCQFFAEQLIPAALQQNVSQELLLRYIGCCFDTCHQAVMNENIPQALTKITALGIDIGKIQLSNAVNATLHNQQEVEQLTEVFKDKKFLHQTKVFSQVIQATPQQVTHGGDSNNSADKNVVQQTLLGELADLEPLALNLLLNNKLNGQLNHNVDLAEHTKNNKIDAVIKSTIEAKIHYHIPINQTDANLPFAFLTSTQTSILATLDFLQNNPSLQPYLEIETYTWLNFLSAGKKIHRSQADNLHLGLHAEFVWLEQALAERNLLAM